MLKKLWLPALCGALATTGCDQSATLAADEPLAAPVDRAAVVLNRAEASLTLIPFGDDLTARTVPLGTAGVPDELEVRGERAAVTMGGTLSVVDLRRDVVELSIPAFGAARTAGMAFVSDTLVLVTIPAEGRLVALNLLRATFRSIRDLGVAPAAVREVGGRVYVAGNDAQGGGRVVALDMELRPLGSTPLAGTSPRALAVRGNHLLVLNAGERGRRNGSVSAVDVEVLREVEHYPGFGEDPSSLAVSSANRLFVSALGSGLVVFDVVSRTFVRSADAPLTTSGALVAARVAADPAGAVYVLSSVACDRPGELVRLNAAGGAAATVRTGLCPVDVEFTSLQRR